MPSSPDAVASPTAAAQVVAQTRAMATDITVRVVIRGRARTLALVQAALGNAVAVFGEVDRTCTRFDPASPLMRMNAAPDTWQPVPSWCFESLVEAWDAYRRTEGRFDPRVLTDLVRLGYDRSLPFAAGLVETDGGGPQVVRQRGPWRPQFRRATGCVRVGEPVDLGGIGKGLAVRWARDRLARVADDFLVEAGGDCYCAGRAPDGDLWRVGVEDPRGNGGLVAVLAVTDHAVATSSIRLRQWRSAGRNVHHIIDPRTGEPGGEGLLAVTVVADDPAWAEVQSKTLFLTGAESIAAECRANGVAALWVERDGQTRISAAAERFVVWQP